MHHARPTASTISIHALLAESDSAFDVLAVSALLISIHALLAESDLFNAMQVVVVVVFLSTLSLRRATTETYTKFAGKMSISIHALLAESDVLNF